MGIAGYNHCQSVESRCIEQNHINAKYDKSQSRKRQGFKNAYNRPGVDGIISIIYRTDSIKAMLHLLG
jgi:hypothetical protein